MTNPSPWASRIAPPTSHREHREHLEILARPALVVRSLSPALLALVALSASGACSEEETVLVHAPSYKSKQTVIWGIEPGGEPTPGTFDEYEVIWKVHLPRGGAILRTYVVYPNNMLPSVTLRARVEAVEPGDMVEVFGASPLPEDCFCQRADDPAVALSKVDVVIRYEDLTTIYGPYDGGPPAATAQWFITCRQQSYAQLRETVATLSCEP